MNTKCSSNISTLYDNLVDCEAPEAGTYECCNMASGRIRRLDWLREHKKFAGTIHAECRGYIVSVVY